MKTSKIIPLLLEPDFTVCAHGIIPPWVDGDDTKTLEAWRTVRDLKRQHDELVTIFPQKKSELDQQFNRELTKQAQSLHDKLFDLSEL